MTRRRKKTLLAARRSAERGAFSKAQRYLARWIGKAPADAEAWAALGDVQLRTGAVRDAVGAFGQAARLYSEQDQPLEAVAVLEHRLLVSDPGNSWAQLRLAELYAGLGETNKAAGRLRSLALACQRAGRHERARSLLRRCLVLTPTDAGVRLCLAEQSSAESGIEEAVAHFALAAEQLVSEARREEAQLVLQRLLFHQPTNLTALKRLASSYLTDAKPRRALAYLERCLREEPSDLAALELLVENFVALELPERALSVLKEIALRHETAGRVSDRNEAYRRVLSLDGGDQQAIEALGPARIRLKSGPEPANEARLSRCDETRAAAATPLEGKPARLLAELDVCIEYQLWAVALAQLKGAEEMYPETPGPWLRRLQKVHRATGQVAKERRVLSRLLELRGPISSPERALIKERLEALSPADGVMRADELDSSTEQTGEEQAAANSDAELGPRRLGRGPADGTLRVGVAGGARGPRGQRAEKRAQLAVIEQGEAEFARGRAFEARGLYGRAASAYRAAMHAGHRRVECHHRIGSCCRMAGHLSAAVDWLKRGLRVRCVGERERLGLLFALAESYESMDDPAEALHCYRQVDAVDPRYPGLRERLAGLGERQERSA